MTWMGVVSDTHGVIRPEVLEQLSGVSLILHAGDIGSPSVIQSLNKIAPVVAVRGNVDHGPWAEQYPWMRVVESFNVKIMLIHDRKGLGVESIPDGIAVVVYGHSHKAEIREENHVLYFNPGSIGPRRFKLPVTMGRLKITEGILQPEIIPLFEGEVMN